MSEWLKVFKSILAAMMGIQKKKNLDEDFSKKSPWPFIIAGLIMTVVFICTILLAVQFALSTT